MVIHHTHWFQFEWDENKSAINKRKHGMTFEAGCSAFNDPFRLEVEPDFIEEEAREAIIASNNANVIAYVAYTREVHDKNSHFRIISVRLAEGREKNEYHRQ